MQVSVVPGVVVPAITIKEKTVPLLRSEAVLPERGGVGAVPLPISHQGMLPICTGVAAANARSILHYQQTGRMVSLSGLFIYKMNRLFDGLSRDTKGSTLEASMQTLAYKGVCPERSYPSNQHNCKREFPVNGQRLLRQALPYRLTEYERCDNLQAILQVLAQRQPVAFSMIIYTDFFAARKGLVPQKRQGQRIGGHSMVAVNYDLSRELVQVVQSWGRAESGPTDRGYMYIPFSWFTLQDEKTARELLLEAFALQA